MRILIVGINFHPELTGIGKYTGEMASFFAEQGSNVHVVTAPPYYPQWEVQAGYFPWRYQHESWQGVWVQRCPIWVPRKPTGITRLLHLLTFAISSFPVLLGQCLWKPDLVLCIAPTLFNTPSVLLMARLSGAKAWLHIQDFELDAASNMGMLSSNNLFTKVAGGVERWILKQFDQISTISNQMLARIESKGIAPGNYFLFPNWVDTGLIYPLLKEQESIKKELHIPDKKTIVLYSGNMGHKQGLEYVLKAARHLKKQSTIHFVLCGDGAIRKNLEKDAQDLPNVQFISLQPLEKLNQLLNIADIHILPQRADAADLVMPSKLSGMLASGKVVITTANPGTQLAEIVGQLGVVVPPQETVILADAILDLSKNPTKMNSLGQKGRSWVVENWSKRKVLTDYFEYMKKWLENN